MADLSSILGGMVQGFKDFGTGLVDMFGTGGAAIGDAIASIQSGRATTKNQDDFRKWLYNTDSTKDAAAKGLGTILNGVSTVADVIPGAQAVTANPLFNGIQGAIGGVADELKMAGENADLGRAAQRAGVGAASGLASGYAGQGLAKTGNKLLSNGLTRGAVSGALGGGIANAGYTGIEGGSVQDMINAGLYGAQTGALVGGTTGLARELIKPAHRMDAKLTDAERQARIENAQAQIDELGPVPLFSNDPEYVAKRARKLELNDAIKAYRSGYDTVDEYNAAMAAKRANKREYKAPEAQYAPIIGEEVILDATQAPEGYTRLYRGLENEFDPKYVPQVSDNGYGYESWSDTYDLAREYAGPNGNVYTVDVPNSRIATQTVTPDGERMPVVKTDKKAGMKSFDGERFIDGKEYLLNVNDPLRQELTYSKVKPKTVADLMNEPKQKTVADLMLSPDDDVMYSKVAEGQLGLFDQPMPTKPLEEALMLDGEYSPKDNKVTKAMRARAEEIMGDYKTSKKVPENELYNKIDESTLPNKRKSTGAILDDLYSKGVKPDEVSNKVIDQLVEKEIGGKMDKKGLATYLFGDMDDTARKDFIKKNLYTTKDYDVDDLTESILKNWARRKAMASGTLNKYNIDNLAIVGGNKTVRQGYTGALDSALSERLGIAPGNTYKQNGEFDTPGALGRYIGSESRPDFNNYMVKEVPDIEEALNTAGHERLHSFQAESRLENRYSKEVADAYNGLASDLKKANAYKSDAEIKNRYKKGTEYWGDTDEQEARMLQQYLGARGFTDYNKRDAKMYGALEFDNDKIVPAFDKFFDKLRALSKKGVALPALTALFGGGAIMAATQGDDKKKKSEVK